MRTPELSNLSWQDKQIRLYVIKGVPWLLGMDVCSHLRHTNPSVTFSRLEEDEKQYFSGYVDARGRKQNKVVLVNEAGVYRLVMSSRCDGAKRFQHWLFHDVLPNLRKHGNYTVTVNDSAPVIGVPEYFPHVKELFPVVINQQLPIPDLFSSAS